MLLACEDASFGYEGATVVSGLSFRINSGDYLCVVGENGSGKSTLLKGILRIKAPQTGSVLTDSGLKANEIGYLPQQTAAQKDFPASAYEVILSGRLGARGMRPFYSRADRAEADKNIELLNITGLKNRCYRELSGGQQQRVLLARALCAAKKLMLLDEPAAGLDPVVTAELYRFIEKINHETGITVVMVSHDVHSAIKYASHILHLKTKQEFFGKTDEYLRSDIGRGFLGGIRND